MDMSCVQSSDLIFRLIYCPNIINVVFEAWGSFDRVSFFYFWSSPCAAIKNILPANEKIQVSAVTCLVVIDCSGRRKKGIDFAHLPPPAQAFGLLTGRRSFHRLRYSIKKQCCLLKMKLLMS